MLMFIAMSFFCRAQQTKLSTDTLPKRDSTIIDDLKSSVLDNIPVISLDDNDLAGASDQNISSLLTAGRDPFFNAATFSFSALRFRIRGYSSDYASTYINNVPMDNLDDGYTPFGLWGGLNDVFRNRDINIGVRYNTFCLWRYWQHYKY